MDYTVGTPMMMQLGSFQFGIATAAYQELSRTSGWRWAEKELFGKAPALQFTGEEAETITMPGVIYPEWRGGFGQVDAMRAMAAGAKPLNLISGNGASLGRWVIVRAEERQTVFAGGGMPRKLEFTLELKRFSAFDPGALLASSIAAAVGVATAATAANIPATAATPAAKVSGLAASVSSGARSLSSALSSAADQVQRTVAPFAAVARDALGAVNRSLGVVGELQGVANLALSSVGIKPTDINGLLQAQNLAARANRALSRAESASAVLRTSSDALGRLSNATPEAVRALQGAQAAADRAVTLTRQTAQLAATIKG